MTTPSIDYSSRDFETIKAALVASVQSKFPSTYRDFTESSMGMMLLELVAYCFDILSYQLDVYCNEMFLPTAKDRESIILLGRLVGYNLRPATSASVVAEALLSEAQQYDVLIPSHTVVSTKMGVKFETLQDYIIPVGETRLNVTLHQGLTVVDEFISDGSPFQEFKLSTHPLINGSLEVKVDGFEWSMVDSLVYSSGVDQSYSLSTDMDDCGYVKFGDGMSGQIPGNGSRIVCSYRVGGGVIGNIPVGDLSAVISGTLVGVNPPVNVTARLFNLERGSGGEERESIEHAKFFIPRWVKANSRAVTEADFDTLGSLFSDKLAGAPAYVKCGLKQRIPELNTVTCWVWGRDELGNITPPSQNLKNAIHAYFNNNGPGAVRLITVDVEVEDGKILYIDIDVDVVPNGLLPDGETLASALEALNSVFDSPSNQPGTPVRMSRLYSALQSANGVSHSLIREVTASYRKTEIIDMSDGNTTQFDYRLQFPPRPRTVIISAGEGWKIQDDGEGRLIGDIDPTAQNTVDYDTGVIDFTFWSPPPLGTEVVIEYRHPIQYQRSEVGINYTNGVIVLYKGKLNYAPVVPNTVAITDGTQAVTDDGSGRLVGDCVSSKPAIIDYSTGAYEFTFRSPPSSEKNISASYVQLLKINSGDIPVEKYQLATRGNFSIGLLQQ